MSANIYNLFRSFINDTTAPYTISDTLVLTYLDSAINYASNTLDFTVKETVTITAQNIANGYYTLTHDFKSFKTAPMGGEGIYWQPMGGNKIRIIEPTAFTAGSTFTAYYKAGYAKFSGTVKDQALMDLPTEAEYPVVIIALGLYMQSKGIVDASNEYGIIKQKAEDGMSVTYAIGDIFSEISNPTDFITRGVDLLRGLPMADNIYFSIKL